MGRVTTFGRSDDEVEISRLDGVECHSRSSGRFCRSDDGGHITMRRYAGTTTELAG